jgi:glycosyltransferase involved in cell wall biosynthesis
MKHPRNFPCDDEQFFVSHIDFQELNRKKSLLNIGRVLYRSIYSTEARIKVGKLLDTIRPDVVHVQNIHGHLTPSILFEFEKRQIPVFWTLHDYKLICPNTHLLSNGEICEACRGGKFYHCALKKCKKNSRGASVVASLEAMVHEYFRVTEKVWQFISPSRFLIDKFAEFGWPRERIAHVPNFLSLEKFTTQKENDAGFVLYVGQLEPWKGLRTLLKACSALPDISFRIVGDGSHRALLEEAARSDGVVNASFEGYLAGEALIDLQRSCSLVVAPSECYENYPYAVMEAMALGKPVIASRLGGLPELVQDELTGYLFEARDYRELSEKIRLLASDRHLRAQFGSRARERALKEFDAASHYKGLMDVYNGAGSKVSLKTHRPHIPEGVG